MRAAGESGLKVVIVIISVFVIFPTVIPGLTGNLPAGAEKRARGKRRWTAPGRGFPPPKPLNLCPLTKAFQDVPEGIRGEHLPDRTSPIANYL